MADDMAWIPEELAGRLMELGCAARDVSSGTVYVFTIPDVERYREAALAVLEYFETPVNHSSKWEVSASTTRMERALKLTRVALAPFSESGER